jgi:cysteine desulfurase
MAPKLPIYMDNNATTPVDPRVLEAMLPYFSRTYGNPSSRNHIFGWEAEAAVDQGREAVAALVGCQAREIVFTSGATESDNLAILGAARALRGGGNHIVTCRTEHNAVLDPVRQLAREGYEVTELSPDRRGQVSAGQVREALTAKTILVTLMLANNEIGTIHPLRSIGALCKERGILLHTDAVQGVGKIPFDVEEFGVDMASISSHKMYGPKGVGALYIRSRNPRVHLRPLLYGGGQEKGMRPGTLNVSGIVGFSRAAEICAVERDEEARRLRLLRARLARILVDSVEDVSLNGYPLPEIGDDGTPVAEDWRLPGNLNLTFSGVEGEALLLALKDVAVSSGSACTSASLEPSHVLTALGLAPELAHASIRFGLGRFTTEEEVDFAGSAVSAAVERLRWSAPMEKVKE